MNPYVESFHINRFRGLFDVSLENLAATNLILGDNNSGKTSVLEALSIFLRPFEARNWIDVVRRRDERPSGGGRIEDLNWLFSRSKAGGSGFETMAIDLSASPLGQHPIGHLSAVAVKMSRFEPERVQVGEDEYEELGEVERPGLSIYLDAEINRETQRHVVEEINFWDVIPSPPKEFLDLQTRVRTLTPLSHRLEPMQLRGLTEASLGGWKGALIDLLKQIDSRIEDLEILTPLGTRPILHVRYAGLGPAPLSVFGDGLRRIITVAVAIINLKNGVLLIDEIENSIHISALGRIYPWLVRACQQNKVQLIATTHSLEALDALLSATDPGADQMACFRIGRPGGITKIERLSQDVAYRLRFERGLDVRKVHG